MGNLKFSDLLDFKPIYEDYVNGEMTDREMAAFPFKLLAAMIEDDVIPDEDLFPLKEHLGITDTYTNEKAFAEFRWCLFVIRGEADLAYVIYEDSVIRILGYVMNYFANDSSPCGSMETLSKLQ